MKKKKIGILTFHGSANYGALMQTYALNTTVNSLGINCETIDYYCERVEKDNVISKIKTPRDFIRFVYKYHKLQMRKPFVKNALKLSSRYDKNTIRNAKYDAYICGSDQVFNLDCSGDDTTYYFDFLDNKTPRFSYAASFGKNNEIIKKFVQKESSLLELFTTISLRENVDISKFDSNLEGKVRFDVDPVFLLNKESWKKLISKRPIKSKYIFMYLVGDPVYVQSYANKLSQETGYKVISNRQSPEFFFHCSPYDFLSWIYNAEYVVTNSFHGTAFSMILNKNFYSDSKIAGGWNYRIENLLTLFNQQDRMIGENGRTDIFIEPVDYTSTNKLIEEKREESLEYLKNIVNTVLCK